MIKKSIEKLTRNICKFSFTEAKTPLIFGNGRAVFSLSQLWNGSGQKPCDYFVKDDLHVQVQKEWKLQNGLFRVLFSAHLNDGSMDININHLKKSIILNQLIQLEASEKEKLVDNPSAIIIAPNLTVKQDALENQISKNILQLDKLFSDAVGLKISYLIDASSFNCSEYIEQLKNRDKAISADVVGSGAKFQELIYNNGYKLEHIFLDGTSLQPSNKTSPFRYEYSLNAVMEVLALIDFKGKLILPAGNNYDAAVEAITHAAKVNGFSRKLQFDLETDGWYTML